MSAPDETFLGNPFLFRSGLALNDFVEHNINRIASIDYGELHNENMPLKVVNFGLQTRRLASFL